MRLSPAAIIPFALLSGGVRLSGDRPGAQLRFAQRYFVPPRSGLVTNEFAYWHRAGRAAPVSHEWEMTSGSLFARQGVFWTGAPDSCGPGAIGLDAQSSRCTNSNVFRLNTVARFRGDLKVWLRLRQLREIHDRSCDAHDTCWHGTHLWLRYRNQYDLYYASINRADGKVAIKRKVPCGSDNSGTYFVLGSYVRHDFRTKVWNWYSATIQTNRDGSVTIKLYDDEFSRTNPIDTATDRGGTNPNWSRGCKTPGRYPSSAYPPITATGAVGIRGDFSDFEFADFRVRSL